MCRNIRTLHNFEPPATDDEVHAAALQYVRKISGTTKPSKANEAVFQRAVEEIAHLSRHLLDDLVRRAAGVDGLVEGIEVDHDDVERLDVCTACDDRFFSHRRDGPTTGRQGVIGYVA